MFNNPFDSFHDMIAEAKQEREQMDRLLTISTPYERMLVAGIAGLLVLLVAWLLFGSVARSLTLEGVLVGTGESTLASAPRAQAMVWVRRDAVAQIKAGQRARIEFSGAGGQVHSLTGQVTGISVLPLSEFLAVFESRAPLSMYRLTVLLEAPPTGVALPASRECQVVIEAGRQSPIARLRTRPS